MYKVTYSKSAVKQLSKLDIQTRKKIYSWIEKNLVDCENPRSKGKALVGNHSGEWRYRVGDYRILAEIKDEEIIIYILEIGHRRAIYS